MGSMVVNVLIYSLTQGLWGVGVSGDLQVVAVGSSCEWGDYLGFEVVMARGKGLGRGFQRFKYE